MEPRQPGKLELALTLASTALMVWFMIPQTERQQAQMLAVHRLRQLAGRLAAAEGRAGMADELSGRDPLPRYGVAFQLSRARDGLGGLLDRMRP
jgi:hypothetical protein